MGILVCNVPDYGTEEVADTTVAMLMAHHRKVSLFYDRQSRSVRDAWDWRIQRPIKRTRDTAVGIIGLGRIGTAVAMRLKGFGYQISFYDPYLGRGFEKSVGIRRSHNMESLIESSDIISVHTPLTPKTQGMIDGKFFDRMKPDAILLNTARGGLFKSADILHRYLKARKGLRIGTDVWPDEPPKDHPLLSAWKKREAWLGDRLIITPHVAFYSEAAMRDIRAFAAELVKTILRGDKPYNVVSEVKRYG
jgi:D-3-phosphoglycerate dehydrogenase